MATLKLQNINKIYDDNFHAVYDFNLDINDKEFIVFVGPSGCGKSTTLRMIAGLEEISSGELYIDGELMNKVEPKDRGIAMVFQNYALYPHMTVRQNMSFALEMRGVPKEERNARVEEVATILGLTEMLDKKPKALSGGQRQRVALGRAIVRKPKVFLMDEPLSNLDAKLRTSMRNEIANIHNRVGATTIYVTHDQTEAMTMADRIVIMKLGFVQQIGTPEELYNKPANLFVATFIGTPAMNIIKAKVKDNVISFWGLNITLKENLEDKLTKIYKARLLQNNLDIAELEGLVANKPIEKESKSKKKKVRKNYFTYEDQLEKKEKENSLMNYALDKKDFSILIGVRPEDICLEEENKDDSYSDAVSVKVTNYEMLGKNYLLYGDILNDQIIANINQKPNCKVGGSVKIRLNTKSLHLFDSVTEDRI